MKKIFLLLVLVLSGCQQAIVTGGDECMREGRPWSLSYKIASQVATSAKETSIRLYPGFDSWDDSVDEDYDRIKDAVVSIAVVDGTTVVQELLVIDDFISERYQIKGYRHGAVCEPKIIYPSEEKALLGLDQVVADNGEIVLALVATGVGVEILTSVKLYYVRTGNTIKFAADQL